MQKALCPVSAVLAYMALRGPGPGPLFFVLRMEGPLFGHACMVSKIKEAISAAGINCAPYSGHSFRSGAATTAAKQGISDATIKTLGCWQRNAYQLYIKTPRHQLVTISQRLVSASIHADKTPIESNQQYIVI